MEYTKENLQNFAKSLSNRDDFKSFVNSRDYELEITNMAKALTITDAFYKELIELVNSTYKTNKNLSFTYFFVLCTMCRRQVFGDVLDLVRNYEEEFGEYEIYPHIRLMAILERSSHSSTLYKAIKESSKLVEFKNENCDFSKQAGVLNVYTALICKYFEYNLDERDQPTNNDLLIKAQKCIQDAIEIEKQNNRIYSKFHLNYGRILILRGKYAKGEDEIHNAISLIDDSADRIAVVSEYNQYLLKSSIIHSYDLTEEKNKDLEKVKVNNYKSIALMTTLLGFLLGAINIFTSVTDPFTLAMLMLCYLGLLLILLGAVLFGLSITMKDKKVIEYIYTALLVIAGAVIFGVTLGIIINKGLI